MHQNELRKHTTQNARLDKVSVGIENLAGGEGQQQYSSYGQPNSRRDKRVSGFGVTKKRAANEIAMIAISSFGIRGELRQSIFRKSSPRVIALVPIFVFALAVNGCKKKSTNPENEIRQFIEQTELNVESRDLSAIKKSITSSYSDGKGFNKQKVVAALQLQFLRRSSIHLFDTDFEH